MDLIQDFNTLPPKSANVERLDVMRGNVDGSKSKIALENGYVPGFEHAYSDLGGFLRNGLKKGDQIIVEAIKYFERAYPYQYPHYYTHLTIQSEISIHTDGVSFEAYDPATNRTRTIVLKSNDRAISQVHVKRFNSELRNNLVAVDPFKVETTGFVRAFTHRGYKWLGKLDRLSPADLNKAMVRLYESLRPGDELVFINKKGDIQKIIMLDIFDGSARFISLSDAQTWSSMGGATYVSSISKMQLGPVELSQMLMAGQIMIGQIAEKPAPLRSVDWQSDVARIKEAFDGANRAFLAGGDLTQRYQANPRGIEAAMQAGQIAAIQNQWSVARVDIQNIMAIRQMSDRPFYLEGRVTQNDVFVVKPGERGHYYLSLNAMTLVGKKLAIDVFVKENGQRERVKLHIDRTNSAKGLELVIPIKTQQEAVQLYAHILESAYGRRIGDATHVAHLSDLRMDIDAYKKDQTLQSKNSRPGKPVFIGRIVTIAGEPKELRIAFTDDEAAFNIPSEVFAGLMWGNNLRVFP